MYSGVIFIIVLCIIIIIIIMIVVVVIIIIIICSLIFSTGGQLLFTVPLLHMYLEFVNVHYSVHRCK